MSGAAHLAKRFVGSLWPLGPSRSATEWAESHLLPGERDLWRRLSRSDRRHTVVVARRVVDRLGERAERPVVAAALLHDVGKLDAGLGTYGRVVATLSAKAAGREMATAWSETQGFTRRVGLYVQHPQLGAEALAVAGSDDLTVAWAREHHLPPEEWTIPAEIAAALRDADDD